MYICVLKSNAYITNNILTYVNVFVQKILI